jgi:hypothetical protein
VAMLPDAAFERRDALFEHRVGGVRRCGCRRGPSAPC